MREEFYSALASAPAEDVPAALDAALQASYENHPRDGYVAGLESLKASHEVRVKAAEAAAKAAAEAEAAAALAAAEAEAARAKAEAEAAAASQGNAV